MRAGILIFFFALSLVGIRANDVLLPRIINFDKDDYQAHNQNWGVAQDQSGLLFFANNMGVLEYDGMAWQTHLLPNKQTPRSIASGPDGKIYSGGYGEFGYWERDPFGQLKYVSLSEGRLQGWAQNEEFWHILVTEEAVFFQSFSSLFRWRDGQLTKLSPPGNIMFLSEWGGRLILPVIQSGLYELKPNGSFTLIPGSEIFSDKTVSCILKWENKYIIGTEKAGLFLYEGGRFTPWDVKVNELLKKYQLNKGIVLNDGKLAFGTILEGAFVVDRQGRVIFNINQENGLQNNTILAMYQDRRSNLWLGMDSGISLIPLGQPLLFYEDRKGLIGSVYAATIFNGRLYVGTNRGLFSRSWPLQQGEDFVLMEGTQGQTWSLMKREDQLLCGHNAGTFRIDQRGRVTKISDITGGWKFCPLPGYPDRILQSTYTGLVLFEKNKTNGEWQFGKRLRGFGLPVRNLIKMPGDRSFWAIVPNEGLYRLQLSPELDSVTNYFRYGKEKGLPGKNFIDLQQIDSEVRVQFEGRLYVYDKKEDAFKASNLSLPEPPGQLTKVLWLRKGQYLLVQEQFVKMVREGLPAVELPLQLIPKYEMASWIEDSLLFFGLDEGFAILNTSRLKNQKTNVPPKLKTIHFSGRNTVKSPVSLTEEGIMEVNPGYKDVYFEFFSPVYIHPVMIRYRLPPFQKEWSAWTSVNHKLLTNLPSGTYQLELQSNTSSEICTQSFRLLPYWYETPWVIIPYILVILFLLYLFNQWHRRRLALQKRKMLVEKERQFQQERIQLRNDQLRKDVLNKSQELANSTFNIIRKNEILITIKEELKKIDRSRLPSQQNQSYRKVLQMIDRHLDNEEEWEVFEENFNEVHDVFMKKLISKYPSLTPGDLKLAAYLKMNLSSKEIAPLLNISIRGVENKRYRLRKKMDLPPEENLTEFMINF